MSWIDIVGQCLLGIVAFLLIFVTANEQSLWLDEVATVSYSDPRLGLSYAEHPAQMPLLYILVFISRVLFGSFELSYRLPVMLMAFGMIQAIPWILKREGIPPKSAWIAPYLLLLLPKFIYYSQEVRAWMPMAATLFFWGAYRNLPGWKGWGLCTVALQSNIFSVFYIVVVVCVDWIYAAFKKIEKPSFAPVVALITHIPSLIIVLYQSRLSELPMSEGSGSLIAGMVNQILNLKPTVEYISMAFDYFFSGPQIVWTGIVILSIGGLFWRSTYYKRFLIGIALGLIITAHLLVMSGWHLESRYLIPLLIVFSIAPFLLTWKNKAISVFLTVAVVFSAHLTPFSLNLTETVSKMDRSSKSKPWQGLVPQLFSRTSEVLIHSERSDWKHLTLLLNAIVEPGGTVLFKACHACWHFPFEFYDKTFTSRIKVERMGEDDKCAEWIVSTHPLKTKTERCGLSLISRLDRFYVYGKKEIVIQRPLLYSRFLGY